MIYAHALHQGPTGGRSQLDGIPIQERVLRGYA
jgi:hypothetical protein